MKKKIEEEMVISPRDKIYSIIIKNPGLHFREIQRRVGFANGVIQYHLDYLKKKDYIREEKEGKFSRFYSLQEKMVDSKIMNLLRQKQVRKILIFLLEKRRSTLNNISKETSLSKTIVNFHLKKIISAGLVIEKNIDEKTFYSIVNKEPILEHLIVYKKSFLDSMVDNFVSVWEEELGL